MLEVGVRLLHLVPDRFWEPDPVLGARLIPGERGWWTQEDREFVVPVQINRARPARRRARRMPKPPDVFRMLVLGDSFVEAMHVPLEVTFPRVLEQQLNGNAKGARIEVMSAGVSGYGTASELLYFEREGKRYQPDLVVLAFYPGNDVKNNSPTLEDKLKPVYTADGALQKVVGEAPRKKLHGWRALLARSAAYHYIRKVLLTAAAAVGADGWCDIGLLQRDASSRACRSVMACRSTTESTRRGRRRSGRKPGRTPSASSVSCRARPRPAVPAWPLPLSVRAIRCTRSGGRRCVEHLPAHAGADLGPRRSAAPHRGVVCAARCAVRGPRSVVSRDGCTWG